MSHTITRISSARELQPSYRFVVCNCEHITQAKRACDATGKALNYLAFAAMRALRSLTQFHQLEHRWFFFSFISDIRVAPISFFGLLFHHPILSFTLYRNVEGRNEQRRKKLKHWNTIEVFGEGKKARFFFFRVQSHTLCLC